MRTVLLLFICLSSIVILFYVFGCPPRKPVLSDWTVMVYMNGANDLEGEALCDLQQFSNVGSDHNLKLAVQIARLGNTNAVQCDNNESILVQSWRGVKRYLAVKGASPGSGQFESMLGNIDMRTPQALEDFVRWSLLYFPAKHYSLIVWDHGIESPRLFDLPITSYSNAIGDKPYKASVSARRELNPRFFPHRRFDSPFLSVYRDPINQAPLLLNSEIKDALQKALNGRQLDVIEFDACLKAMVETAYAMRGVAQIMIASEDTALNGGWNYAQWLDSLKTNSSLGPRELADVIIRSYAQAHDGENLFGVTQSAIILANMDNFTDRMDEFVEAAVSTRQFRQQAYDARSKCNIYGGMNGVDFACFLTAYEATILDDRVHAMELRLRAALEQTILENYGNYPSRNAFGSNGLSIYYPASKGKFEQDTECKGYDPRDSMSIEFVKKHKWMKFLDHALGLQGLVHCQNNVR